MDPFRPSALFRAFVFGLGIPIAVALFLFPESNGLLACTWGVLFVATLAWEYVYAKRHSQKDEPEQ